MEERITQFKCFTEIKQYVEAADVMLQFKQVYQMSVGFEDIDKIFNQVSILVLLTTLFFISRTFSVNVVI